MNSASSCQNRAQGVSTEYPIEATPLATMQIFRRSNLPWVNASAHPPKAQHDAEVRKWLKEERLPEAITEPVARQIEKALARKPKTLDLSELDPRALDAVPVNLLLRLREATKCLKLADDCPLDLARKLMHEVRADSVEPAALMAKINELCAPRPHVKDRRPSPGPAAAPPQARDPVQGVPQRQKVVYGVPPRREPIYEQIYDVPPRREPIYDVPPRREPIYDVPPQRSDEHYAIPGSLINRPGLGSPSDAAQAVPGSADDKYGYLLEDPAALTGKVYVNQSSIDPTSSSQRKLIEHMPPRSPLLVTIADIDVALTVMRMLNAWHRTRASTEGPDARCAMSHLDAEALARALSGAPLSLLKTHERGAWLKATAALASRRPGTLLEVEPDTIRALNTALEAVRQLASDADTGDNGPPLPPPRP